MPDSALAFFSGFGKAFSGQLLEKKQRDRDEERRQEDFADKQYSMLLSDPEKTFEEKRRAIDAWSKLVPGHKKYLQQIKPFFHDMEVGQPQPEEQAPEQAPQGGLPVSQDAGKGDGAVSPMPQSPFSPGDTGLGMGQGLDPVVAPLQSALQDMLHGSEGKSPLYPSVTKDATAGKGPKAVIGLNPNPYVSPQHPQSLSQMPSLALKQPGLEAMPQRPQTLKSDADIAQYRQVEQFRQQQDIQAQHQLDTYTKEQDIQEAHSLGQPLGNTIENGKEMARFAKRDPQSGRIVTYTVPIGDVQNQVLQNLDNINAARKSAGLGPLSPDEANAQLGGLSDPKLMQEARLREIAENKNGTYSPSIVESAKRQLEEIGLGMTAAKLENTLRLGQLTEMASKLNDPTNNPRFLAQLKTTAPGAAAEAFAGLRTKYIEDRTQFYMAMGPGDEASLDSTNPDAQALKNLLGDTDQASRLKQAKALATRDAVKAQKDLTDMIISNSVQGIHTVLVNQIKTQVDQQRRQNWTDEQLAGIWTEWKKRAAQGQVMILDDNLEPWAPDEGFSPYGSPSQGPQPQDQEEPQVGGGPRASDIFKPKGPQMGGVPSSKDIFRPSSSPKAKTKPKTKPNPNIKG